ncbi:MAG: hypothetical protein GY740_02030, partial [Gammaproteobacteria bacterium]|nr:hypothetical protein [Gammaproteobacteria bacterium]
VQQKYPDRSVYSQLKSMVHIHLKSRDQGIYEAVTKLLRQPLSGCSDTVATLKAGPPHTRMKKLKYDSIDAMKKLGAEETDLFCNNFVDN